MLNSEAGQSGVGRYVANMVKASTEQGLELAFSYWPHKKKPPDLCRYEANSDSCSKAYEQE